MKEYPREIITPNDRSKQNRHYLDTFTIIEDENYILHLVNKENEEMHFYSVLIQHPQIGTKTVFVFAQSTEDAKAQAACSLPNHYNQSKAVMELTVFDVAEVPFLIRGWSAREF